MGFYLRKSIKVGAFRFNLSKSGIGVSAGVKGFRVGTGPRGNYVHMGANGIYYRASVSGKNVQLLPQTNHNLTQPMINDYKDNLEEIESGSVLEMTDSSSVALLDEIRNKHKQMKYWPIALIVTVIGVVIFNPVFLIIAIVGGICTFFAYKRDEIKKSVVLFYEFEGENETTYQKLHDAFSKLTAINKVWHIEASGATDDWKRNSGATSLIRRKSIQLKKVNPPYIKTNIEIPAISVGRQVLYFFPDRLLVYDKNEVGAVNYNDLNININQTRFIESETVPSDSKIVDHTWKYVNKNGGPDKRFKDNCQLPIVLYEKVHFTSKSGLNEMIQLSKTEVGEIFKIAIKQLANLNSQINIDKNPA